MTVARQRLSLLPHLAVGGVLLLCWLAGALSSRASRSLSRHPLSGVYSDLPFSDPLLVLAASFVAHWALFMLCPVPSVEAASSDAASRGGGLSGLVYRSYVVSTVHALTAVCSVVCWLSVYSVEWRSVQRGMGGGRRGTGDEWHSAAVAWSLGYFLYDSHAMAVHRADLFSAGGLFHHLSIGAAFAAGLYLDCCRPFHFLYLLEELSTPPLNLKSLLRGRRRLSDGCALLFAASFLAVRLGYGSFVFVAACQQLGPFVRMAAADGERAQVAAALFQFVMCAASRLLNFYWAALILRKLARAVGGADSTKQRRLQSARPVGSSAALHAARQNGKTE